MIEEQNDRPSKVPALSGWWAAARAKPAFWIILFGALAVGFLLRGGSSPGPTNPTVTHQGAEQATTWTCSMHPQIQLPEPGQCPICFMDLIPVTKSGGDDEGPRVLAMSETAKKIARVVSAPVTRRYALATIQMVGKVDYDETRLAHISAWVPGRLDRLFVDYTGVEVEKGDHMVEIYSPELLAAQEELLQAIEAAAQTEASGLDVFRETAQTTIRSARDKLRLWGLADEQIKQIEASGTPSDHIVINAPSGGVVVEKSVLEGKYVKTGTHIYTIADLTHVWLKLEAYESDLKWLRYGQEVVFTTEALPGETFTGTISFIDPVLDPKTRTVKIRVNVPNLERKLKPSMFVRATVTADVAASGQVMHVSLSGKWICRMHPEVVKDHPGDCDVCGMPLVTAESLGYTDVSKKHSPPPLVIPASAPLITGKRAVVYVELPDRERPTYEGREVVLGPRAGDFYIVESGLEEGERVVVNGAFKIDSELQIRAGPSMMQPEGGASPAHAHAGHDQAGSAPAASKPAKATPPAKRERLPNTPPDFSANLTPLYTAYFQLQRALVADNESDARSAMERLSPAVGRAHDDSLADSALDAWQQLRDRIAEVAESDVQKGDWDALRSQFEKVSAAMIELDYLFGHPDSAEHFVAFCPMAFDNKGAYWLQNVEAIANPYFGQSMPKCGKVTDRIHPNQLGNHD